MHKRLIAATDMKLIKQCLFVVGVALVTCANAQLSPGGLLNKAARNGGANNSVLTNSELEAATRTSINPEKYPIKDIRGGEARDVVTQKLSTEFEVVKCSGSPCVAQTEKKAADGQLIKRETIQIYFNGLGEAEWIKYNAKYSKGAVAECVSNFDQVKDQMTTQYGSRYSVPNNGVIGKIFQATWGADGVPKNFSSSGANEYFSVDLECSEDGYLSIQTEFRSEAIQDRKVPTPQSNEKPTF